MAIKLEPPQIEIIRQHGARDYPSECCGMLLGRAENGRKLVSEAVPLRNLRHDPGRSEAILPLESASAESERNRFLIDPIDQIRVEKDARARGLDVVGYYHSHPDHPAQPSVYDRDHAWPWYSYVIISIERGEPKALTSWVLRDDRTQFDPEEIA